MPVTISHALSATTPDNPAYEIRPSHWNSSHDVTLNISASEIVGLFSNANNVSFGLSNNSITASIAAAPSPVSFSAGTQSSALGALALADSNGVSFGLNAGTITATVRTNYQSAGAYLTTAMLSNAATISNINVSAGTTSNNLSALTFSNLNGLAFGLNGSVITGSYSQAAQTNQSAIKAFGATNTGNTAGNTGVSTGVDWVIAGTNNITVSESTAVGGPNTIWLSGAAGAGGGTGSVYFAGNTTQNSSSTQDYSSVIFGGRGAASVGVSGGSIQISVPATSSLVGTGGISLSSNGSTISISNTPIAMFEPYPLMQSGSTTYAPGAGSWYMQPVYIEQPLSGGRWNFMVAHGSTASVFRATTANFNSNTTGSMSITGSYERRMALYSLGAGTNSTRLESFWSNNFPLSFSHLVGIASAAGPNLTVSAGLTVSCITSINSNGSTTLSTMGASSTIASASSALASTAITTIYSSVQNALSSQLMIPIPFNTTLNPGAYWIGHMWTTASGSTTTGTNVATTLVNTMSVVNQYALFGNTNTAARAWLQTAASSGSQPYPGVGFYSVVSAVPPTTMAFSDIRTLAAQPLNYVNYVNSAI